ncbi:MAG: hypothetical protein GY853_00540 [PVC group bacterium]|nr:hypothetical protein [PVC group bacterium]
MKEGGAKEFRMLVGYELLMLMERNEDLPLPNIKRLSKVMDEYYHRESVKDYVCDEYSTMGYDSASYKWESSQEYWQDHMSDVKEYMREEYKLYFDFLRDKDGGFKGIWKFMTKGEWERTLKREHNETGTRVENHNKKVEDTSLRWQTDLPQIGEVPKLT